MARKTFSLCEKQIVSVRGYNGIAEILKKKIEAMSVDFFAFKFAKSTLLPNNLAKLHPITPIFCLSTHHFPDHASNEFITEQPTCAIQ